MFGVAGTLGASALGQHAGDSRAMMSVSSPMVLYQQVLVAQPPGKRSSPDEEDCWSRICNEVKKVQFAIHD
jgi:hypothetical protein